MVDRVLLQDALYKITEAENLRQPGLFLIKHQHR
jgi:hypothetical protein